MNVLDKGFIELVDVMGGDATVVNAARVSFAKSIEVVGENDARLINYLAKNKHISPFYHPQLSFRIKAPISVQRQWFKHKIGTAENSESTRYIEVEEEFYIPFGIRSQSKDNKQGSGDFLDDTAEYSGIGYLQSGWHEYSTLQDAARTRYIMTCLDSFEQYRMLIEMGVAKEQAREILPLCTYTSWIWTASLAAVAHFIKLRTDNHAQFEIRQYAEAMRELAQEKFPLSLAALLRE